jgi:hypothetical protein
MNTKIQFHGIFEINSFHCLFFFEENTGNYFTPVGVENNGKYFQQTKDEL